ncbi:MAG: hypothetical protein ACOCUH_01750 [Bacteriovoracia bacterium]
MQKKDWDISILNKLDPSKVKVLVGMTGRLDSTVAAFLLKKQGFQVAGIGINLWAPEIKEQPWSGFENYCSIKDMEKVQEVCNFLDIPFYGVNGQGGFFDEVVDPIIAASLVGKIANPCPRCHRYKLNLLWEKTKVLGYEFLATAHFAKIYKNHRNGDFVVYSGNNQKCDQSQWLMELSQEILSHLILPLAELQQKEVERLAQNFNLPVLGQGGSNPPCFAQSKSFAEFVEYKTAESLHLSGHIINRDNNAYLGDHSGFYHYKFGAHSIQPKFSNTPIDGSLYIVDFDFKERIIFVDSKKHIYSPGAQLYDLHILRDGDCTKPIQLYMHSRVSDKKTLVTVYFKNNQTAYLEFDKPLKGLYAEDFVSFYNRDGVGAKLVMTGKINYVGPVYQLNRLYASDEEDIDMERATNEVAEDFKF